MPRRLTIYLEGPPTDGLRVAQDHFKDYVKPILVSSGLDWEFIQGRKEGDVRAELAERIRKFRTPIDETIEEEDPTMRIRRQNGVKDFDGPQGDIVIGRHTWKEYVRGLHEGWLGPLKAPLPPPAEKPIEGQESAESVESRESTEVLSKDPNESSTVDLEAKPAGDNTSNADTTTDKPKKPPQPPPFISTSAYQSAPTPSSLPSSFDPSIPISFPHILGFTHTPLRLYRFLNRRHLADAIGRETAAIILANYRSYHTIPITSGSSFSPTFDDSPGIVADDSKSSEQATALAEEEKDWHKATRKRVENEPERTWLEEMVLDPRIAGRMRRAELSRDDEERANQIVVPEEEIEGWIKGSFRGLWRSGKAYVRLGRDKRKPTSDFGDENLE
jgi:mitochondrial import inner membrane translocase subunit TIM54